MTTRNDPICGAHSSSSDRLAAERSSPPWTKALVTLAVLAICLGARQIALPTVTTGVGLDGRPMAFWSIMALGVWPLLYGYLLVEFAALLVPAWRPLRVGGPAGRAKLHDFNWLPETADRTTTVQRRVASADLEFHGDLLP
jgi:hypothetical protein